MYRSVRTVLGVSDTRVNLRSVDQHDNTATATFDVALTLRGLGIWRYRSRLSLRRVRDQWRIVWSPTIVHPRRRPGTHLVRIRRLPPRAPLLDRNGVPLFRATPVVTVGVVPSVLRKKDRALVLAALKRTTGSDPERVRTLMKVAPRNQFVAVITLRRAAFRRVESALAPLPGVRFQAGTADLPPTRTFGRALLGQVGPATAEALPAAGRLAAAEDQIGLWGLQRAFQRRLAGTPTGGIALDTLSGRRLATLYGIRGRSGHPVRTTIDARLQRAAESALRGVRKPTALVAVDASSGAVRAVANVPAASSLDRALIGRYPPGSTFKVVTTEALLAHGLNPRSPAPCPASALVSGRRFTNFEQEQLGAVPFSVDFARSCNAAFVLLARKLGNDDIHRAAKRFGFGSKWTLPLPAYSGQAPRSTSAVDRAAATIGQDNVLASPLGMALVAGAVADGTWRPPLLVTDPPQPAMGTTRLPAATVADLRELMRGVVTSGTGSAANLPGSPVYGKTGTAEFGGGNPPSTHAWFIGFRGNLAFAVLVEGGGVGGQVAAPIAARFLDASARLP
jgi:cell division protein FtsI/penicillin-binding protein 2